MAQVVASPTNAAMAARLERDVANLRGELTISQRKLSSKSEALIILSADLDACRTERDQYKLMAEQLQSRHVAIKKQLAGVVDEGRCGGDLDVDQLWRLLADHQAKSKTVALEAEDLKQRLAEAEGDNRALREQLGRHRMGEDDEAVSRRSWSASEREALVATLEGERRKSDNLKRDMREVLDQKEELVVERDALKTKHERLNKEMNLILKGDPERILDLDAMTMENAYLKQELTRIREEQSKAAVTLTKYRGLLEKRMAKVVGPSKAKTFIEDHPPTSTPQSSATTASSGLPPNVDALCRKLLKIAPDRASPQAVAHLQKLVVFLHETLQDRSLAITHQRKTNQILAKKIQALENRLRNLGQTNESTFPHVPSAQLENVDEPDDDSDISNSLESCCVSSRTFSRGESPPPPPPRKDSDAADPPGAVTDDDGRLPPLETNGEANATETGESPIAGDDGIEMTGESQLGERRSTNNDDVLSIADSFSEFQSADDRGDALFNDASLLSNGSSFATQTPTRYHPPHFSESDYYSGVDGSPPAANVASEAANKDLLSWEFDGQCDDENCRDGSARASSPAILTPTVLK